MGENNKSKLEGLTLKDNFMFGAVMCEPENCRPFLEMALGISIGKLDVSIEKSLVYHPEYKGVRLEKQDFILGDGQTTMFLSTRGKNPDEVPAELVSFLKFVGLSLQESTKESEDGYVRQLQAAVRQVKASREWEARFVIFEEMLQEQREAGKAEGRAEGKAEDILILLEGLPDEVPKDLREYLFSEKDSDVLHRYLKLAASASSVEEFARQIRQ